MLIADWLANATSKLVVAGVETARLDAELLLAKVLNLRREQIFLLHHQSLTPEQIALADSLLTRRALREPLGYILQETEFFGVRLYLDRRVLIPRPETELLCELALNELEQMAQPSPVVIDVGTGSTAIALALALNAKTRPVIYATDYSLEALAVAKINIDYYNLHSVIYCLCLDVLQGLRITADLIIANPPYVAEQEWQSLMPEVQNYEPRLALVAGNDGLSVIRQLIPQASALLRPGGVLMLEIAPWQKDKVAQLASATARACQIEFFQDYSGKWRFAKIKYTS